MFRKHMTKFLERFNRKYMPTRKITHRDLRFKVNVWKSYARKSWLSLINWIFFHYTFLRMAVEHSLLKEKKEHTLYVSEYKVKNHASI
jgi:hypothetical protein